MSLPVLTNKDHEILGGQYCSGYLDIFGKWNNGFYCPQTGSTLAVYCCGTPVFKYCCIAKQPSSSEQSDELASFFIGTPVIIGVICGIAVILLLIVLASCYFCSCCCVYKKRREHVPGLYRRQGSSSTGSALVNMYSPSSTHNTSLATTPLDVEWSHHQALLPPPQPTHNQTNMIVSTTSTLPRVSSISTTTSSSTFSPAPPPPHLPSQSASVLSANHNQHYYIHGTLPRYTNAQPYQDQHPQPSFQCHPPYTLHHTSSSSTVVARPHSPPPSFFDERTPSDVRIGSPYTLTANLLMNNHSNTGSHHPYHNLVNHNQQNHQTLPCLRSNSVNSSTGSNRTSMPRSILRTSCMSRDSCSSSSNTNNTNTSVVGLGMPVNNSMVNVVGLVGGGGGSGGMYTDSPSDCSSGGGGGGCGGNGESSGGHYRDNVFTKSVSVGVDCSSNAYPLIELDHDLNSRL